MIKPSPSLLSLPLTRSTSSHTGRTSTSVQATKILEAYATILQSPTLLCQPPKEYNLHCR